MNNTQINRDKCMLRLEAARRVDAYRNGAYFNSVIHAILGDAYSSTSAGGNLDALVDLLYDDEALDGAQDAPKVQGTATARVPTNFEWLLETDEWFCSMVTGLVVGLMREGVIDAGDMYVPEWLASPHDDGLYEDNVYDDVNDGSVPCVITFVPREEMGDWRGGF